MPKTNMNATTLRDNNCILKVIRYCNFKAP
jgi:hypothetical protein